MNEYETLLSSIDHVPLQRAVLSDPRNGNISKIRILPITLRNSAMYQAESFKNNQVFHQNLSQAQVYAYVGAQLRESFCQAELQTADTFYHIRISKKGKITISRKKAPLMTPPDPRSHNRSKQYILEEGTPVPFLVSLGIMSPEGKVLAPKYDKF